MAKIKDYTLRYYPSMKETEHHKGLCASFDWGAIFEVQYFLKHRTNDYIDARLYREDSRQPLAWFCQGNPDRVLISTELFDRVGSDGEKGG